MAGKRLLPADLTPDQVVALQDALLANADRLLQAAAAMLDRGDASLARSLAILGMEESGKAIALHERRVQIVHSTDGQSFVDQRLLNLWGMHSLKLETVHDFLVREEYWFGTEPSDPERNAEVLGTIEQWKRDQNQLKQRGFYVDVSPAGDPITPSEAADADAVRAVVDSVHQIGWQLRLGEHIEGKRQHAQQQGVSPASEEEIEQTRHLMRRADPRIVDRVVDSMRVGVRGKNLQNAGYGFVLPENPFENVGRPGYEAQDRELRALARDVEPSLGTDEVNEQAPQE
ncbi:AbiV family abortive infection protein [Gordonia sp. NPDC127522]|uniref:AbiV family abortive infection protein n=1 Tax=Gordonia sp. NPDC127522 TaxID=3345390 RepID=UPI003624BF25